MTLPRQRIHVTAFLERCESSRHSGLPFVLVDADVHTGFGRACRPCSPMAVIMHLEPFELVINTVATRTSLTDCRKSSTRVRVRMTGWERVPKHLSYSATGVMLAAGAPAGMI